MAAALYKDSSAARKERLGSFSEEMGKTACVFPLPRKSQGISSSFGLVFSHGKFLAAADSKETWGTQSLLSSPGFCPLQSQNTTIWRKKRIFPVEIHETPGKERLVECTAQWI